jgi:1-deoxy-D-xylulose-5-phosphate reductoisomerase
VSVVRVAVAGSSGSIGVQTLEVVRAERDRYEVVGLGVGSSVDVLVAQANEFRPKVVAVADPARRAEVAAALPFAEVVPDLAALAADAGLRARLGEAARRRICDNFTWRHAAQRLLAALAECE